MKRLKTFSSRETEKLGEKTAEGILSLKPARAARVLALTGELGSGKTTFVKGFFKGLRAKEKVSSPTFIMIRRTPLGCGRYKNVFHADLYRLKSAKELIPLGLKNEFKNPQNIVLVEWAEKAKAHLPAGAKRIYFRHGKSENERVISMNPVRSRDRSVIN